MSINQTHVVLTNPNDRYEPYTSKTPQPTVARLQGYTDVANNASQQNILVDSSGHLQVDIVSGGGGGDATAANQVTMINHLDQIEQAVEGTLNVQDAIAQTSLSNIDVNTADLNTKFTVGDDDTLATALQTVVYGRKDATPSGLRALKTDFEGRLMVDIDRDSAGLATEATLSNIDTKITAGDDDTLTTAQQVAIYARKDTTPTGLRALKASDDGTLHTFDGGLNTKITCGADDSITGDLQQNLVYGRYDANGDLKAVKCSSDGSVITAPVGAAIITSDGTTSEQRVMILGNYNGNLRTLKVGQDGELITEIDHSWDNTNVPINNVALADGADTSGTFDLGQGVSHEIGNLEIFVTNSAGVNMDVTVQTSPDGTNYFTPYNAFPVMVSSTATAFAQADLGATIGNRYFKFIVTNNDGFGTSTDVTLTVAYYK